MNEDLLLGTMRQEYNRASRLGFVRLGLSFSIIVPPMLALADQNGNYVYQLAVLSFLALVAWLTADWAYKAARNRSLAARRALMISSGIGEDLDPLLREQMREITEKTAKIAPSQTVFDYYSTKQAAGPRRMLDMVEESAFYSENTHRHSGKLLRGLVVAFASSCLLFILFSVPAVTTSTLELSLRLFMIVAAFFLSGDLWQRATQHLEAATECRRIQQKCLALAQGDPKLVNAMLLLSDYLGALENAHETLPWSFSKAKKTAIEKAWETRKRT